MKLKDVWVMKDVWVKDSPFDPDARDKIVQYKTKRNKTLYKVYIYLNGPGLPFIRRITYYLHPTFQVQHRSVKRSLSNPNCKLAIWVWGKFRVRAIVEDKKGNIYEISHYLDFDSYFDPKKFEANKLRSQAI